MTEVSEIEAGGEVRTIKDATARQGVAANAAAIEEINTKIPSNASSSNQMATASDLANKMNKPPASPIMVRVSELSGKYVNSGSPLSWQASKQGLIKIHYANINGGYTIYLNINDVEVDGASNLTTESDHGTLIGFVYEGQTVTVSSDASNNKILALSALLQVF